MDLAIRFFGNITFEGLSSLNIFKTENPVFELEKLLGRGCKQLGAF